MLLHRKRNLSSRRSELEELEAKIREAEERLKHTTSGHNSPLAKSLTSPYANRSPLPDRSWLENTEKDGSVNGYTPRSPRLAGIVSSPTAEESVGVRNYERANAYTETRMNDERGQDHTKGSVQRQKQGVNGTFLQEDDDEDEESDGDEEESENEEEDTAVVSRRRG
jgi:hypothetical protein